MEHLVEVIANAAVVTGGLLFGFRRLEARLGTLIQFEQQKHVDRVAAKTGFATKQGRDLLRARLMQRLVEKPTTLSESPSVE